MRTMNRKLTAPFQDIIQDVYTLSEALGMPVVPTTEEQCK